MIIVTNSLLCKEDFFERIKKIVAIKPSAIILREKHLTDDDYEKMAVSCKKICDDNGVDFFVNSNIEVAIKIKCKNIHVSFYAFIKNNEYVKNNFLRTSVAVHSVEEGIIAQRKGADSIVAGHIFNTDCKKGIEGRGVDFIEKLAHNVSIPINAIGGISLLNYQSVLKSGASDFCIMSGAMTLAIEEIKDFV